MYEIAGVFLGYGVAQVIAFVLEEIYYWWIRRKPAAYSKSDGLNYTHIHTKTYRIANSKES